MKDAKEIKPSRSYVYKSVESRDLSLHVFNPKEQQVPSSVPGIIFFFGGGWKSGTPAQFFPHCEHLASLGMVAISAEYRVNSQDGTTPIECVKDGKSAIRWIRKNAKELGIDPNRLAGGGGSAGGHVAAACATLDDHDDLGDHEESCVPDALVLFNPVFDNGPDGYGYDRVSEYWETFSPMHNLKEGVPPTLVMLGTHDELIPVSTGEEYQKRVQELGGECELILYENQEHGFFNLSRSEEFYGKTVSDMDNFLKMIGFLSS